MRFFSQSNEPVRPTTRPGAGRWPRLVEPEGVFAGEVALGNATQWKLLVFLEIGGPLHLGIQGKGYGVFSSRRCVGPEEVVEAFQKTILLGDAGNLADLVNCQINQCGPGDFGRYHKDLCNGGE